MSERRERYALLADVVGDGRGARFARRCAGAAGPRFADIAHIPAWLTAPPEQRERTARLVALLRYRPAIDAELSGTRLAMLAEAIGEDLLDAACEAPLPADADDAPLPSPDRLAEEGWALLHAALPTPLAGHFPGARDDPHARALVAQAAAIA